MKIELFYFILILILGITICIALAYIFFVDFLKLLLKFPFLNEPKGYNDYKKLRESDKYKHHKKKWRRIFILLSIVYATSYIIISIVFQNILFGFFAAVIALTISYGIASGKESKERKEIQ